MKNNTVRQVSISQSEEVSIEDWAKMSHLKLLEIGYQLRQQYLYAYNLTDKVDKTHIQFRNLKDEE